MSTSKTYAGIRSPCCKIKGITFVFIDDATSVVCCRCNMMVTQEMLQDEFRRQQAERREDTDVICRGCQREIDPDTCWCGSSRKNHGNQMDEGHLFVPMGCRCFMSDNDVPPWPPPDSYQVIDWPFPWPRPQGIYSSDGPRDGYEHDIVVCNVLFRVKDTGKNAFQTGRRLYHTECLDCGELLHENTSGPSSRIRYHLNEAHKIMVRW